MAALLTDQILLTPLQWKSESRSFVSDSLWPQGLYSPWNSPGQNTGGGSLSLLQGLFPTQGSNPGLPHCRRILYRLNHQGSPRILKWVVYPFSSGSFQHRNWTGVSCIAGGFVTSWTTREAPTVRGGHITNMGSVQYMQKWCEYLLCYLLNDKILTMDF